MSVTVTDDFKYFSIYEHDKEKGNQCVDLPETKHITMPATLNEMETNCGKKFARKWNERINAGYLITFNSICSRRQRLDWRFHRCPILDTMRRHSIENTSFYTTQPYRAMSYVVNVLQSKPAPHFICSTLVAL